MNVKPKIIVRPSKPLPDLPKVYVPKGDAWYIGYRYDGDKNPAEVTRAMNAMWNTLLDAVGIVRNEKNKFDVEFTVVERSLFIELYERYGAELHSRWASAVRDTKLKATSDSKRAKAVFRRLISSKSL